MKKGLCLSVALACVLFVDAAFAGEIGFINDPELAQKSTALQGLQMQREKMLGILKADLDKEAKKIFEQKQKLEEEKDKMSNEELGKRLDAIGKEEKDLQIRAQTAVAELQKNYMDKAVEALKKDFSGLRTGRASTALLDGLMVEAYGAMTPLSQVGTVSVPESRMLSVQVWDRSLVKSVEKAIRSSELGLNPMNDGQLIRIPIPPLNEERRIELTKIAAKYTEQARIAVRNIRRDAMDAVKKMQKDGDISEDEQKKYETEIQNMTDATIKTMDEMLKVKDQEIKQV